MTTSHERQQLFSKTEAQPTGPSLARWVESFLLAKRAAGLTTGTVQKVYRPRLNHFVNFCGSRSIQYVEAVDATLLREYLLELAETHNPGGCHQFYRIVKTFLRWYEVEGAADGWRNPIRRVPPPKVPEVILEPANLGDVGLMIAVCEADELGQRDRAIFLTLLDTGLRATELTGLDLADFDFTTGALNVRKGKGGKSRVVFLGQKSRKAVRAYLRLRGRQPGPLFLNRSGDRLDYLGLRSVAVRRALQAGVPKPSLHSFRRAFALAMLRNGSDLLTLQRLMGHADLSLLQRYAKQTTDDLRSVHAQASPVDRGEY